MFTSDDPMSILCVQVAGFAAGRAVILAVFAETDFEDRLAEAAVFFARTGPFRQIANRTNKILGHGRRVSKFLRRCKITCERQVYD
jgi:hypothetical protein